jgi:hypothetical protein
MNLALFAALIALGIAATSTSVILVLQPTTAPYLAVIWAAIGGVLRHFLTRRR